MSEIAIIDMGDEIKALKAKHGENYRMNTDMVWDLAKLWGVREENHDYLGLLNNLIEVKMIEFGKCEAIWHYQMTDTGVYLIGLRAQTSISGFGYSPSLWDQIGFTSYDHARRAAIERFIIFFDEVVNCPDHYSKADVMNAKKAVMFLKAERNPQMSLFEP